MQSYVNAARRRVTALAKSSSLVLGVWLLLTTGALAQFYRQPTVGDMIGYRIGELVIGAGLGFAVGAFFSPALKAFRRIAGLCLAAAVGLFALFGPVGIADGLSVFVAIALFFVGMAFGIRLGAKAAERQERKRPTSFGSAKWADLEHLQKNNVIGMNGFMLGDFRAGDDTKPLSYEGVRHLLTVAPTRSGKGVSSIIPNLLTYEGSAFVIDPKGENALVTALRRGDGSQERGIAGLGQKVVLLDPWDIAASQLGMKPASFNPLDWITPKDPDAAENAFLLAEALVPKSDKETSGEARFWDEESKALLTGVILYVATAPEEKNQRNLGRVRDILVQREEDFLKTLTAMYEHPHPVVVSTATRTSGKDPKLLSNVLASAQSHTHFLDSPRIRKSLEKSDFGFEDLKASRMSVYLILPADRLKTFDRWLRLLVQQAITVTARNIETKPKKPILFLLDEMASIGHLPSLEQAYSLMAGFGMQLWGIVQDLSQLARIYGETGWQTFISNSGVIQYFGSRDKMTAEYFSTLCGVTTVEIHNFSWAVGQVFSYFSSSTSGMSGAAFSSSSTSGSSTSDSYTSTVGTNEAQRQLAYPDELMVLKGHQQIVFVENLDPIAGEKIRWYEHPVLTRQGVNLQATEPKKRAEAAMAA